MSTPAMRSLDPIPSTRSSVKVDVVTGLPGPDVVGAVAVPVSEGGDPPSELGHDAATLEAAGFTGKRGQTLVLPERAGRVLVAVGIGCCRRRRRRACATSPRSSPAPCRGTSASRSSLPDRGHRICRPRLRPGRDRRRAAGPLAASSSAQDDDGPASNRLVLVASARHAEARRRAARGAARSLARAAAPGPRPGQLPRRPRSPPTGWARSPRRSVRRPGSRSRSSTRTQLIEMGCGGLLGVNRGSVEQPRMIRLRYRPEGDPDGPARPGRQGHHVRLRRHQPQAERRVARADEERHDRRGRGARRDDGAARRWTARPRSPAI